MKKAGVQLLEPIMRVEVLTPDEHMGDVIGNLNSRRGVVQDFEDKPGAVKASDLGIVACGCVRARIWWHEGQYSTATRGTSLRP